MASWFSEGTVTVTNGNAVVTGIGTKFSNCRSGDMFVGPDNGIYQVINPSSDTSVSISPAYRGATSAGATYGIVPVNGYPKALADAVNLMVQQWGATLAGLGSVSTENVVPVAKGGTGGTTQATARNGLGLGTAATRAVGTAATNLMEVGAGGWLGTTAENASTVNDYKTSFKLIQPTTAGSTDLGYQYGAMLTLCYDAADNRVSQLFFGQVPGDDLKFRSGKAGTAQILKIYHTGNTTRAQDGTLKAI